MGEPILRRVARKKAAKSVLAAHCRLLPPFAAVAA